MEKVMIKRLISVCFVAIIVFGIFGCAKTAGDSFVAETETVGPENTAVENEEDKNIEGEEAVDTADAASKSAGTAVESSDVLREMDEYRNHFIGLYTSNALSDDQVFFNAPDIHKDGFEMYPNKLSICSHFISSQYFLIIVYMQNVIKTMGKLNSSLDNVA